MKCITKRQVLAMLAAYSIVRGTVDELRPVEDRTEEADAYDKVAYTAVTEAIKGITPSNVAAKVAGVEGGK